MSVEARGRDLFIVDNSVSGWTGLRYLEEWSEIAKAFDIATGYLRDRRAARARRQVAAARKDPHPDGSRDDLSHPQGASRGGAQTRGEVLR